VVVVEVDVIDVEVADVPVVSVDVADVSVIDVPVVSVAIVSVLVIPVSVMPTSVVPEVIDVSVTTVSVVASTLVSSFLHAAAMTAVTSARLIKNFFTIPSSSLPITLLKLASRALHCLARFVVPALTSSPRSFDPSWVKNAEKITTAHFVGAQPEKSNADARD
jgi:hypothetical protein